MATSASNVRVGVTGAVYYAATGTTLPTTIVGTPAGFTEIGYVGEDGVTESQPTDVNEIRAWQNGDIVRYVQTSHELTYTFPALETNNAVQTIVYGGVPAATTAVEMTGAALTNYAYVIDVDDGTKRRRICIPEGQLTARPDVTYANGDARSYEISISCLPNASDVKAYVYEGIVS